MTDAVSDAMPDSMPDAAPSQIMDCTQSGIWVIENWTCLDGCESGSPLTSYQYLAIAFPNITILGGDGEITGTIDMVDATTCTIDIDFFSYTVHDVFVETQWPEFCIVYSGYPGPLNHKRVWCLSGYKKF